MNSSAPLAAKPLGEKTFTDDDQQAFAQASHDHNPMHVDAVAARRLVSGQQVVHGIHTLIHALDLWRPTTVPAAWQVACTFSKPVNVGDTVLFSESVDEQGRTRLGATVQGLVCTELVIGAADEPALQAAANTIDSTGAARPRRHIAELRTPLDETPGSQVGTLVELAPLSESLATRFPHAAALLGIDGLSAVAQLSFFVGMVCPGLHSVFSSVQFSTGAATGPALAFDVRRYDSRLHLFIVGFDGPIRGELRAFLRPPPQPQPSAGDVAARLAGDEFRGTRALVIGGSRGLGEITAKIIAGGGGDVLVSYALGRQDAEAVAADINGVGRGRCGTVALDLRDTFAGAPGVDAATLDAVYFFPTPRIYAKRKQLFDRAAFDEFATFYLQRFHELCSWLDAGGNQRSKPLKVYLPSTVFITERPKGMTEYAMAKAAAEVLADDINRNLRNVRVLHTRLPRMATDQTASILKVTVASNLDEMLAVVQQMSA